MKFIKASFRVEGIIGLVETYINADNIAVIFKAHGGDTKIVFNSDAPNLTVLESPEELMARAHSEGLPHVVGAH